MVTQIQKEYKIKILNNREITGEKEKMRKNNTKKCDY